MENISNDDLKALIKEILTNVFKSDKEKRDILSQVMLELQTCDDNFDLDAALGTNEPLKEKKDLDKAKDNLKILETMAKDAVNAKDGLKALKLYESAMKIAEECHLEKQLKKYKEITEKLPVRYRIELIQDSVKKIKANDNHGQWQKNIEEFQVILKLGLELLELKFDLKSSEIYNDFMQALFNTCIFLLESALAESNYDQRTSFINQLFQLINAFPEYCQKILNFKFASPVRAGNIETRGIVIGRYIFEFQYAGDIEGNKCKIILKDFVEGIIEANILMRNRIYESITQFSKSQDLHLVYDQKYLQKETNMSFMEDHYYLDDKFLMFQRIILNQQFECIFQEWNTFKPLFPEPPFSLNMVKPREDSQTITIYHRILKSGITFEWHEQAKTATLNIQQKVSIRNQNSEFRTNCIAFFNSIKPDIKHN